MFGDSKSEFLSEDSKKLNIGKTYLKIGLFDKARAAFQELKNSFECGNLANLGIQLCDLKIKDIELEDDIQVYEAIQNKAIATNDVVAFEKAYKEIAKLNGGYVIEEELLAGILDKFNLCTALIDVELKKFVERFANSYMYYNLLDHVASGLIEKNMFYRARYYVDKAIEVNPHDPKAFFNRLLMKVQSANEKELINIETNLDTFEDFNTILMLCETDEERLK